MTSLSDSSLTLDSAPPLVVPAAKRHYTRGVRDAVLKAVLSSGLCGSSFAEVVEEVGSGFKYSSIAPALRRLYTDGLINRHGSYHDYRYYGRSFSRRVSPPKDRVKRAASKKPAVRKITNTGAVTQVAKQGHVVIAPRAGETIVIEIRMSPPVRRHRRVASKDQRQRSVAAT